MSNQQPPPRRRRIAGERRGATSVPEAPTQRQGDTGVTAPQPPSGTTDADGPESRPGGRVSLLKRRETTRRGATPVAPAGTGRDRAAGSAPRTRAVAAGGRRLVLALAALLVVLLLYIALMLLGLLGTDGVADLDRADQEAAAGRAAQASAERAAGAVLAYDFRTLEEDRDAATRFMTEEYATDYVDTFDTAVLEAATESKAQVSVEVQGSAVLSASVDKVRVLLFLDQATLTADAAQPKLALNRVEMIMVEEGDTWKVSDVLSF